MIKEIVENKTQSLKVFKKRKRWTSDDTELSILAIPTFIWFVLFSYIPMFGIIIAFKNYKISPGKSFLYSLLHSQWVGFDNFQFFIKSNALKMLLRNTIGYNIIFIALGILIPVTLAIMISMLFSKRKSKVYQTMMFFPHFMSWVVVSYFVYAFLSMDKGILNSILKHFGQDPIRWYSEPKYWPFILVFMNTWKTMGYGMVVYLACITGIDGSLYEAAVIDGASKWQQAKYITIPFLKQIVIMMFILSVGKIFYSDFGLFYQITQQIPGSLNDVASTLDTYVFKAVKSAAPIGMTSAVSFVQSTACCITILLANWIIGKIDKDYTII
ncbi:ABC transporter permease subunit [Clostridium estertheticum]|uniref:ABC transporter permease n=1 Tax=Clostridium estertheticum TaxID=238834 RepID=UPI0013E92C55|nr:ABC transporter permease subunit [Clostridium estertheticum]MBZ9685701.1 ABC transporter permease subunit [Clostridium estertheticum]